MIKIKKLTTINRHNIRAFLMNNNNNQNKIPKKSIYLELKIKEIEFYQLILIKIRINYLCTLIILIQSLNYINDFYLVWAL